MPAWFKANGFKKKKVHPHLRYEVECDTDDEDGRYPTFDEALLEAARDGNLAGVEGYALRMPETTRIARSTSPDDVAVLILLTM